MRRNCLADLISWKNGANRKPLLMDGARQVGKTWLLKEFGRTAFRNVAYVSLDKSRIMRESFAVDNDIRRILEDLSIVTHERIIPGETLVVIDEIQTVPAAVTALKYFCEDAPECFVAAAGSLLGLSTNYGSGFPVGKTDGLYLHPMSFIEFMEAVGEDGLAEKLRARDWATLGRFRETVERRLRQYYYVGGMPAAVEAFSNGSDYAAARREQRRILSDYRRDFAKHVSRGDTLANVRLVWDSVPRQLARENRKFVYGAVRTGGRGRDFETAIEWLSDAGVIHRVKALSKPGVPLASYMTDAFKVFGNDVGLLAAQVGLEPETLLDGNRVFVEFKGALTEQYVQQEMRAAGIEGICYWAAEGGTSEVDFVVDINGMPIPVEVKAERNLKAKSLKVYEERYSPLIAVKTSMTRYATHKGLLSLPLYGVANLAAEARDLAVLP